MELKDLKDLEGLLTANNAQLAEFTKDTGKVLNELKSRMTELEQGSIKRPGGEGQSAGGALHVAETIMGAANFKDMMAGRSKSCIVPIERKTLIQTPTLGTSQALVGTQRLPEIMHSADRRIFVRDLLPQATTTAAAVEYTRETAYTNAADIQGAGSSPAESDGQPKGESSFSFSQEIARAVTVAHWVPASVQVLDDAVMLANYIGNRLVYGLRLKENNLLLNATGNGIEGLVTQATAYNRGATADEKLDTLRKAITQLEIADALASGIVLNPSDLEAIELNKDTTGQYIVATVNVNGQPVAWRVPVASSNDIAAGTFLVGDFMGGAQIWDRQVATVEISRDHEDFFTRNLVAIRAECRLALTVYRPGSFVTGAFQA